MRSAAGWQQSLASGASSPRQWPRRMPTQKLSNQAVHSQLGLVSRQDPTHQVGSSETGASQKLGIEICERFSCLGPHADPTRAVRPAISALWLGEQTGRNRQTTSIGDGGACQQASADCMGRDGRASRLSTRKGRIGGISRETETQRSGERSLRRMKICASRRSGKPARETASQYA